MGGGFVAASVFVAAAWGNLAAWLFGAAGGIAGLVVEAREYSERTRIVDERLTAARGERERLDMPNRTSGPG
jgi:hypothetical protein